MTNFLIAFVLGIIVLYVPGFMLAKSFRLQTAFSLALAPVLSICCYEILAIVYQKLGIFASFFSLFIPTAGFAVVVLLVSLICGKISKRGFASIPFLPNASTAVLVLYVLVGVFVGANFFLRAIGGADSFCQEWDNGFHLNVIRSFVDSGIYSTLTVDVYSASAQSPYETTTGVFYPTAWHLLCAMIASLTGATVTVAMNAVNFLVSAVVFQSGMYCLLEKMFGENRRAIYAGALVASAFTTFPWMLLSYGPIYPNLLSMTLLPVAMTVFMILTDDESSVKQRVLMAFIFIASVFVLAVSQTNTVFAAVVLLWPYLSVRLFALIGAKLLPSKSLRMRKIIFYAFMALILLLLWFAMSKMPLFAGLYATAWPSSTGEMQGIIDILTASYRASTANLLLGALILIGCYSAYKSKKHAWLLCSYILACFMLFIAMTTDGSFKQFLVGIWYTDQFRVAAVASVAATPLACLGLALLVDKFIEFRNRGGLENWAIKPTTVVVCLVAVVALGLYSPSFSIKGLASVDMPFGDFSAYTSDEYADAYLEDESAEKEAVTFLDSKEQEFLDKVAEITDADNDLVINSAFDGSVFAYGTDGINVLYKSMFSFDDSSQTDDSKLIKHNLDEVAWNTDVQEAVHNLDAKYVLLLDYGKEDTGAGMYETFGEEYWDGIVSVTDNTPGFEVVLAQDDMRLYRIVC